MRMSDGLGECLAEGDEQTGDRHQPAVSGPELAVHPRKELPAGKRGAEQQNLEILVVMRLLH